MRTARFILLVLVVASGSCSSSDNPADGGNGSVPVWTQIHTAAAGMRSIWGATRTSIFVAGNNGKIEMFDGSTWADQAAQTTNGFRGLGGVGSSEVYAVGDGAIVRRFNGQVWIFDLSGALGYLSDIWAAPSVLYSVGANGQIFTVALSIWTPMTSGTIANLRAVHGTGDDDVFAVGDIGVIMHYDGSSWAPMVSNTTEDLLDVFAITPNDVVAVGEKGTIVRYNGSTWQVNVSSTTEHMNAVWADGANAIFVGGNNGVILRRSVQWTAMDSKTTSNVMGLWGTSLDNVYAVTIDGGVMQFAIP